MFLKKTLCVFSKSISFFVFGLGGLIFSLLISPIVFLFIIPSERANRIVRTMVSSVFRLFTKFSSLTKAISFQLYYEKKHLLKERMIICANHPTLLDAVFLIGIIPNADCIVKSSHWNNPVTKGVVSRLYIPNSLNAQETINTCRESLNMGNNIILFPEGTRSNSREEAVKFYRSAAQIALRTGHDVLPVFIDVNSPTGLGKGDSFFSCPEEGIVKYNITIRKPIKVLSYNELPTAIAARRLTEDIKTAIFS